MEIDLDPLEDIFEKVQARFVDITLQRSRTTNIVLKDGIVKDVSLGESFGVGARVLGNTWGFASSNSLEDALPMAERAARAARHGERIAFRDEEPVEDKVMIRAGIDPLGVEVAEKKELLYRGEEEARKHEGVASTSLVYLDSVTEYWYMSSEGSRIESAYPRVALYATVFAKEDGKLQMGSERMGGTGGLELLQGVDEAARRATERALRLLKAKSPPSGAFRVVLDPNLTGVFIHEALGHAVEADHVIQGESILTGRLGGKIASEEVTIYDDATLPASFGFYFYDSEGTRGMKKAVIDRGVLRTYLHSRETASVLGQERTGNARAQGCNYQPIVRMSNTYLEPRDHSLEELVEGIENGVYLIGSRGGEVDPGRGVFQFSAEEGFLIEKGRITQSVKDVALSGETLRILEEIDAVGKDFGTHIGFCGKAAQQVPVGDGGPHVRTVATVGGA